MSYQSPPRHRRRWTAGRRASVALGAILGLCALALLGLAAVLAIGGVDLETGAHGSYRSPGYALLTDGTDWRDELLGTVGSVRLRAASDGPKPIFVGVAKTAAVRRYLRGVDRTTIDEDGDATTSPGDAPATAPEDALDWTAESTGVGTQTLRWDAGDGRQTVVAMNADGSPAVSGRVLSSTVTLRPMPSLAAASSAVALALLAAAAAFVVVPIRRARRERRPG